MKLEPSEEQLVEFLRAAHWSIESCYRQLALDFFNAIAPAVLEAAAKEVEGMTGVEAKRAVIADGVLTSSTCQLLDREDVAGRIRALKEMP